jgi:hypothetical protein
MRCVFYKLAASPLTFTTSMTLLTALGNTTPTSWAHSFAGTLSALRRDGRAK